MNITRQPLMLELAQSSTIYLEIKSQMSGFSYVMNSDLSTPVHWTVNPQ